MSSILAIRSLFPNTNAPAPAPAEYSRGSPRSACDVRPDCETVFYSPASNLSVYEADSLHSRIASAFKVGHEYVLSHTDERRDMSCNRAYCIWLRLRSGSNASNLSG